MKYWSINELSVLSREPTRPSKKVVPSWFDGFVRTYRRSATLLSQAGIEGIAERSATVDRSADAETWQWQPIQDERLQEAAWAEADDLDQLIDDYSHLAPPAQGELLRGHVLSVTPTEVIVDVGYKSEGIVPIAQFTHPTVPFTLRPAMRSTSWSSATTDGGWLHRPLPRESDAVAGLGQPRESLP